MSARRRGVTPSWTPFGRATRLPIADSVMQKAAAVTGLPIEHVRAVYAEGAEFELWKNSRYQVAIDRSPRQSEGFPKLIHLSIKRLDRAPIHDWRDLQRIKNELVGPEHEAIELYPAESRVTDSANQFHLWCFADPNVRLPFGWTTRFVLGSSVDGKSKQRPFEEIAQ